MSDRPKTKSGYTKGEWSTKPDYRAECLTCGWKLSNDTNALGAAARHSRAKNHCVHVERFSSHIYNHEPA